MRGAAIPQLAVAVLAIGLAAGCGGPGRDNPADPDGGNSDSGIELVAAFPGGASGVPPDRVSAIRYSVSDTLGGRDIGTAITGTMNLIAGEAVALVPGVPAGTGRVFRVDAFDQNEIRTFSASDTVDVSGSGALPIRLALQRLTGTVELTSQLPPEISSVDLAVVADGDTLRSAFTVDDNGLTERIEAVPTGSDVEILLEGSDAERQILIQQILLTDVRDDLVARLSLNVETGAVGVVAIFPEYLPQAEVDRFSDAAGSFFRRSENPALPEPDEAIDLDALFLHRGLGPNGEAIEFYHLDIHPTQPAPVYILVDRRGDAIAGQLPIFDALPGDASYSDLKQVWEVAITDRLYSPNTLTSLQAIEDQGLEAIETGDILNCVMVPAGSSATRRYGSGDATALQSGWVRDQLIRYFLFEGPQSNAQVAFESGEISAPLMYGFFDNDEDFTGGFAVDDEGNTHNVVTRLPGQEGYAPLWAVRIFLLDAFDRVVDVATAQDQERAEESILQLDEILYINAPIVSGG